MKKTHIYIGFLMFLFCLVIGGCNFNDNNGVKLDVNALPAGKISDYCFFKEVNDLSKPNAGVIPYKLANTMFNDYSLRRSFLYLPKGLKFSFGQDDLLDMPEGGCIINVIYFPNEGKSGIQGMHLVETQLLIKKQNQWEARDYVWSEDQKDALLNTETREISVSRKDKTGSLPETKFTVYSKDECKRCHMTGNRFVPIGVKEGNLNVELPYGGGKKGQLNLWRDSGLLANCVVENAPQAHSWRDTAFSLEQRAKAYLDANCAYCHKAGGQALASGMFLNEGNRDEASYGICKQPLSKGRGTCYLKYDIVPGDPSASVLICRMSTSEYGVKMPELGRSLVDTEGLALITAWIGQMKVEGRCDK